MEDCCLRGFQWEGTPKGRVESFPTSSNQAYVVGDNKSAAILLIHDAFGWDFANNRLLTDHLAEEVKATVYLPDFFGGVSLPKDILVGITRWKELDLDSWRVTNSREVREPEIFACAKKLRAEYKTLAASGYCYGGWAVFRLGAKGHNLVDCISTGHPSWLTNDDIDNVAVPTQILAPSIDPVYTAELKEHTWKKLQENGIPFDYQHFPGVAHACFIRGDANAPGERDAMVRGKNAVVHWFKQYLHS